MTALPTHQVRIKAVTFEAENILALELRAPEGGALPAFTAGSHIDLHLADGLVRSYSLVNSQDERHRYVIAVALDRNSRGGSRHVHQNLRVGDVLTIGAPRNNFVLDETASHSVLIAGGIGVTPLWCMAQRLEALGRSWELHYCARTRRDAALLESMALFAPRHGVVRFNFDGEPGGAPLDLAAVVGPLPPQTHVYCCGPVGMLQAFEAASSGRPRETVHVEYFSARGPSATGGGFAVELARSRKSFEIPPGKTILQALLDAGVNAPYSCMEGVCGSCEVRVIEGQPDHRDLVLSDEERAQDTTMMICCSGCKGDRLVLDL